MGTKILFFLGECGKSHGRKRGNRLLFTYTKLEEPTHAICQGLVSCGTSVSYYSGRRGGVMITLKTLPSATAQEVFDQVARHLLTQNAKSYLEEEDLCAYRHAGLKCAAGCLIGDDEYRAAWEGRPWIALAREGQAPATHMDLIQNLQRVHDTRPMWCWPQELRAVAAKFGLSSTVLEEH